MAEAPRILLEHHLKRLKLPTFLREYEKLARQCAAEGLDHVQFLARLVELELIDRERRLGTAGVGAPGPPVRPAPCHPPRSPREAPRAPLPCVPCCPRSCRDGGHRFPSKRGALPLAQSQYRQRRGDYADPDRQIGRRNLLQGITTHRDRQRAHRASPRQRLPPARRLVAGIEPAPRLPMAACPTQ